MALTDTFTDTAGTALTSHTADAGGSWTMVSGTSPVITAAGRVRNGVAGASSLLAYHSAVPPSADYEVSVDVVQISVTTSQIAGLITRYDSGSDSCYMARYIHNGTQIQLYRRVSGTFTLITSSTYSATINVPFRISCLLSGNDITVKVDGSTVITYTDGTPVSGAGRAGIALASNATPSDSAGLHLDNFDNGFTSSGVIGPLVGGRLIGGMLTRGRLIRA